MKNRISVLALVVVASVLLIFRGLYPTKPGESLKVTTFDAMGYYMYNPSIFIYGDVTELKWVSGIEEKYQVTGGLFYQASELENGGYTNKYLGGVAIMQLPFFFAGHAYASITDYPSDGFSAPYQYAIAYGAIIYVILGLLLVRNVLLRFYRDVPVAISIFILGFGTNLIQYTSIDSGQSHAYIFPLYALVLWATIKWHENVNWKWAALIGFTIGLATICRPTELIMVFIPLLWHTHTKEARKTKWQLVRKNLPHVYCAVGFGLLGVLPQLIYWKYTTGSFIYDVGSKWFFLNPWFRVLFGVNNGFFIYTPLTILFVVGFFLTRGRPFHRSVITFCLLNIWIITAWSDWRYGATYSTRAMVQSYPVFALALAGSVSYLLDRKQFKWVFIVATGFLMYLNIFQIRQYNNSVLHYHDMNWRYYSKVFLNASPTALEFSLLDSDVWINESSHEVVEQYPMRQQYIATSQNFQNLELIQIHQDTRYLKVALVLQDHGGADANFINVALNGKELSKIRLKRPLLIEGKPNDYAFYVEIPKGDSSRELSINIVGWSGMKGEVISGTVTEFK